MQKTRFDRWLQKKFALETHVYTMRPCAKKPRGFRYKQLPDTGETRFLHLYITRKERAVDRLLTHLRDESQMFTTRVVDRKGMLPSLLAPKDKSVFYMILWAIIFTVSVYFATGWVKRLWSNPTVRENVMDAIEVLKK